MRLHPPKYLTTLLLAAALLCAAPATLWAQAPPTQEQLAEAQRHADRGTEYFFNKDYSKALVEFFKGYDLSGNPLFLYNISLTYQKLEELDRALSAAEEALALPRVDPELQAALQARIHGIPVVNRSVEVAEAIKRAAVKGPEEPKVVEPEGGGLSALGWTGVASTVVGAGILGYTLILAGQTDDKFAEYEAIAKNTGRSLDELNRYNDLNDEIEADQQLGQALLYTGSAFAGLGLILLVVDLASDEEAEPSRALRITPTEGGARVGFHGSF